jgi:hypothetical protein
MRFSFVLIRLANTIFAELPLLLSIVKRRKGGEYHRLDRNGGWERKNNRSFCFFEKTVRLRLQSSSLSFVRLRSRFASMEEG